jgi:hypothetical protein
MHNCTLHIYVVIPHLLLCLNLKLSSVKLCHFWLKLVKLCISWSCRKIRLIEGNAKCRHLKSLLLKGLFGRCLSVWGPEPHTPPNPYTLYTCIQYTYSAYSHTEGGGGKSWTKDKVRGATVHKAGSKIPTILLFQVFPVFKVNMLFLTKYSMFLVRIAGRGKYVNI